MVNSRSLFNLILLALMLIMVILAFGYNEKARMIPLAVGIVTSTMLFVQFLGDQFLKIGSKLTILKQGGLIEADNPLETTEENQENIDTKEEEEPSKGLWLPAFQIMIWLTGFAILMMYTSYLLAVPVFLFLFIWLVGKAKINNAAQIALGMLLFIYVLFDLLLKSNF